MVARSLAGRSWRAVAAAGLAFLLGCGGGQDATPQGAAPSGLAYAIPKLSGTVGLPVTPDVPSVTGTVTRYAITPALPGGLNLSSTSGVISGTPTAASPLATYTVTAQNTHGSTSTSLAVQIAAAGAPPANLSYAYPSVSGTVGIPLPANAPGVTGAVTAYAVQPAFPAGIVLDPGTGIISGTPAAAAAQAAHVVTASNPYGSTATTVQVQVTAGGGAKRLLLIPGVPPTSDVVLAKRANLEASPFDGLVFAPKAGRLVFRTTAYTASNLAADAAAIPQINSARLTDNFLLMRGGLDTGFDPFNDAHWTTALANVTAFAQLAKAGNLAGIAFDPEGYANLGQSSFFDYRAYDPAAHTFQACQANARLRGQQFMNALQAGYPGSNLMFFGALCLLRNGTTQFASPSTFPSHPYGLMPDFLNGVLDVAAPGMVVTDGFEATYTFYRSVWYGYLRDLVLGRGATLLDPALATRYAAQVRTGMAIYMDATFDLPNNPTYLAHWLAASDRPAFFGYQAWWSLTDTARTAWVYSEAVDWVNRAGIPAGAEAALLDAKARVAQGQALGLDLDPILRAAAAAGGLEW